MEKQDMRQILDAIERLDVKQDKLSADMTALNVRLAVNETLQARVTAVETKHQDLHSDFTALKARFGVAGAGIALVVSSLVTLLVKFLWPPPTS